MTREEELWAAIIAALNGDDVDVPVPAWRREEFLVGILGAIKGVEGASVPEPVWREEQYLKAMFDELSSGGGGSSYTLLKSAEFTVNTSSTTAINIDNVSLSASISSRSGKMFFIKIRDKAGKRNGYLFGADIIWRQPEGGSTANAYKSINVYMTDSSGKVACSIASEYGVYPSSPPTFTSDSISLTFKARYSATYTGTINGTYVAEIYELAWPNDDSPFK